MNWVVPYQSKRDRYWPEVEAFFSHLPPHLFQQGVLLKNDLATFYTDSGQFKDMLGRERDHPLLYLHFWLLDDWGYPNSAAREALEKQLFLAMIFAFAAVYTQETILDFGSNFGQHFLLLQQTLSQQADTHLTQLFSGPTPFWEYHRAFWQDYAEAVLTTADRRPQITEFPSPIPDPRPLAFSKIPLVAVALSLQRDQELPHLCTMLDRLNLVFQTWRDVSTLRRDLAQRRWTYPLLRAMQEAGLDPLQPLSPERLLGALVLTGTMGKIGQECLVELEAGRTLADSLNLPRFSAYFEDMRDWLAEVRELFDLKSQPREKVDKPRRRPLFAPFVDTLPKVIEMAEGYLLSDLTFRESWEVQRRGVFGEAEMTGKAFPMGLIVEILSRHGHAMTAPINEVFATLQATGFRYYDHPHLPPDADDLGLLLRLYPYSSQPEQHRDMLQEPLGWLENSLEASGEIPVWLKQDQGGDESAYPFLALWGQSCATVEANVLLGLLDYEGAGYRGLIEKSAVSWSERVATQSLGATHHYVPLYALWTAFELIFKLNERYTHVTPRASENKLPHSLNLAAQTLTQRLGIEAQRPNLSPQDAAFLTLTCLRLEQMRLNWGPEFTLAGVMPALNLDWITLLCKSQRYDGSWAGEPLFGTPTRGEFAAWYSSRSVTTAFCYHALKVYHRAY
ncbi:MAG: hypothetical protein BroJett011_46240 [Chloroflexota bacterium]|nr:MAG: hypothetical protein BroJett011_46240 [Chloroflexota bacterium]